MIISRTPFRISFFGGGTDYPEWYREHGGAVLATTIDKFCYISVRELPPFFEHKFRVVYSIVENVREIREIQHPAVRGVHRRPDQRRPRARWTLCLEGQARQRSHPRRAVRAAGTRRLAGSSVCGI